MKFFKLLSGLLFIVMMIVNCKTKEQESLPTIDTSNYDVKDEQGSNDEVLEVSKSDQNINDTLANAHTSFNSLGKTNDTDVSYHDEFKGKSMVGHFIYFADAAVFTPCGKTKPIPVQMGTQEYLKLEKAYSNTVEGGTPCFAEFLGKIEKLPSYDGGKKVDMIVVQKLIEVQLYRDCP